VLVVPVELGRKMGNSDLLWKSLGSGLALTGKWTQTCGFTSSVSEALRFAGNLPGIQGREAQGYFNDAARRLQKNPPEIWMSNQLYAAANWCGYTPPSAPRTTSHHTRSIVSQTEKIKPKKKEPISLTEVTPEISPSQAWTSANYIGPKKNVDQQEKVPFHKTEQAIIFVASAQEEAFQGTIVLYDADKRTLKVQEENMPGGFPKTISIQVPNKTAHEQLLSKGRGLSGRSVRISEDGEVCIEVSKNERNPQFLER